MEPSRPLAFLKELSERLEGWSPPVDHILSNPPAISNDYYPTITAYGIPGVDTRSALSVSAAPSEITVTFDTYHTHFSYEEGGHFGREHAFVFIAALQRESYGVATQFRRHKPLRSWVLNPSEGGCIAEYPLMYFKPPNSLVLKWPWERDYLNVRTWKGSFDRDYDLRMARKQFEIPLMGGDSIDFGSH
jgi:hypothetical protein